MLLEFSSAMLATCRRILQLSHHFNYEEASALKDHPSFCYDNDDLCVENEYGVAKTNVSVYDLQAAITRKFGVFAQIGEMDCELISEDQGYNSKVVVLRNIWKSEELAVLNEWPKKICAKLATLLQRKDAVDKRQHVGVLRNFYNVEIDVYRMLSGSNNALEVYAAQKFENGSVKGFLLMEFVEEAKFFEMWEHISDSQMEEVMRELARLHSLTPKWKKSDHRLSSNEKALVDIFMNRLTVQGSHKNWKKARQFLKDEEASRELLELTNRMRTVADKLFQKTRDLELPTVFGHADLWNGNVMFQNGTFKAIIDYQTCHMVQLGFEFGRLFAHLASEKQRSRVLHFFQIYKKELDRIWPKNPITRENFLTSWELMFPFHYWLSVMCRGVRSWTTERAKNSSEAEEKMRLIMKTMTKEAADGLSLAIQKYLG